LLVDLQRDAFKKAEEDARKRRLQIHEQRMKQEAEVHDQKMKFEQLMHELQKKEINKRIDLLNNPSSMC